MFENEKYYFTKNGLAPTVQKTRQQLQLPSENRTVGFWMVIFRTLFESGFRMLKSAILFRKPDDSSGFQIFITSLQYRFIQKKIFLYV